MGFNKRYISITTLKNFAKSEFKDFGEYLTNSDALILNDFESISFIQKYKEANQEQKKDLYKSLISKK